MTDPPSDAEPDAAAQALARARAAASAKGLRPGSAAAPRRSRRSRERTEPDGRDPTLLGDAVSRLVADRGWELDLEIGAVMGRWPQIVGEELAAHCTPVTFAAGALTVKADSTAWATELQLLRSSLLARIAAETGPDTVTEVRIVGPAAPTWKHGRRRVADARGPRDTYG